MAKKRITKVYTKTGDDGQTSLIGGIRVSKSSPKVEAFGDVDELNALLGITRAHVLDKELGDLLVEIQNDLFIIGADLASPADLDVPRISEKRILELESIMDSLLEDLEPLKEFILPSGSAGGAYLHFARTVSRRAERRIVYLMQDDEVNRNTLVYMNRLSDLLFVMARIENKRSGFKETFVEFKKDQG